MANNSVVTQDTLQTFYDNKVYPYLNGATHTGCVPLGTVLPYYGETAPEHFLICDGTEYLKSDYGELATHLLSLTDPTPYQGSDADHFKVPDLRGEFLRGSGTNSHTNQGSGGDVGEHQDATEHIGQMQYNQGNAHLLYYKNTGQGSSSINNSDSSISRPFVDTRTVNMNGSVQTDNYQQTDYKTSRPTNTSVTYIIAYQNAYIDLALDGFPIDITQPQDGQLLMYDATAGRWVNGGHKYSTDEHIVGTWIDGKPVYEKTYHIASFNANTIGINDCIIDNDFGSNNLIKADGFFVEGSNNYTRYFIYADSSFFVQFGIDDSHRVFLRFTNSWGIIRNINITIQYTKTTDT